MVERFTTLLQSFSKLRISAEAYVCIKAVTLLHYNTSAGNILLKLYQNFSEALENNNLVKESHVKKVQVIQDQFVKALQIHLAQNENSARLSDILQWLVLKFTNK